MAQWHKIVAKNNENTVDKVAILKKDLAEHNPARLYVFHGEESYLKSHYLGMLEKECAGIFPDFDLIKLDGDIVTSQDFIDAIESLPMGGERKIVEVLDYNIFGSGALKDILPDIIEELPDYICLVFVYDALEYKADARLKLYKSIEKNGVTVEFKRASNNDLVSWIRRRFSALDKEISPSDCERMIFICGPLMNNLVTEIEKIAAGTKGKIVRAEDIEKMASRSLEAGIFDLTDELSNGRLDKALSILSDLIDMKNDPIKMMGAITKHFRRLYGARLGIDRGLSVSEIRTLIDYRSDYPTRIAMTTAQRFSVRKLRNAQKLCLETDLALKSNNSDAKRAIELFLVRVMA